jgi:hypothetical protein
VVPEFAGIVKNLAAFIFGLFGILVAVAWLTGREETAKEIPLSERDPATVGWITLTRPEQADLRFERRNDHWRITEPYRARANQARIDALLGFLNIRSHRQIKAGNRKLDEFGLDAPRAELSFDDLTLKFGATHPVYTGRYVLLDDTIHLVADNTFHQLLAPATDYVDSQLLYGEPDIRAINLPDLKVNRRRGAWQAVPGRREWTGAAIEQMVAAWRTARAQQVRPIQNELPLGTVQIWTGGDDPIEFRILDLAPELVLAREQRGVQYHFAEESALRMLKPGQP